MLPFSNARAHVEKSVSNLSSSQQSYGDLSEQWNYGHFHPVIHPKNSPSLTLTVKRRPSTLSGVIACRSRTRRNFSSKPSKSSDFMTTSVHNDSFGTSQVFLEKLSKNFTEQPDETNNLIEHGLICSSGQPSSEIEMDSESGISQVLLFQKSKFSDGDLSSFNDSQADLQNQGAAVESIVQEEPLLSLDTTAENHAQVSTLESENSALRSLIESERLEFHSKLAQVESQNKTLNTSLQSLHVAREEIVKELVQLKQQTRPNEARITQLERDYRAEARKASLQEAHLEDLQKALNELREKLSEEEVDRDQKEGIIAALKTKISSLQIDLEHVRQEKSRLLLEKSPVKINIDSLTLERDFLSDLVNKLKNEQQQLNADLQRMVDDRLADRLQHDTLRRENTSLSQKIQEMQHDMVKEKTVLLKQLEIMEIEQRQRENEILQLSLREQDISKSQNGVKVMTDADWKRLSELVTRTDILEVELSSSKSEAQSLRENVLTLVNDQKDLLRRVVVSEKMVEERDATIEFLNRRLQNSSVQNINVVQRNDQLEAELQTARIAMNQASHLKSANISLGHMQTELANKLTETQQVLFETETTMQRLSINREKTETEKMAAENRCRILENRISEYESERLKSEAEIHFLKTDLSRLQSHVEQFHELSLQLEMMQKELDLARSQESIWKQGALSWEDYMRSKKEVFDADAQTVIDPNEELLNLGSENAVLVEQSRQDQLMIQQLQETVNQSSAVIDEWKIAYENVSKQSEMHCEKTSNLTLDLEKIQVELTRNQAAMDDLKCEKSALQISSENSEIRLAKVHADLHDMTERYNAVVELNDQLKDEWDQKLQTLEAERTLLESDYRIKVSELTTSLLEYESKWSALLEDQKVRYDAEISRLVIEFDNLKKQIAEENVLATEHNQFTKTCLSCARLQLDLEHHLCDLANCQGKLTETTFLLQKYENQLTDSAKLLSDMKEENDQQKTEILTLHENLVVSMKNCEALNALMTDKSNIYEEILLKCQLLESEKIELQDQVLITREALSKHDEEWQNYASRLQESHAVENAGLLEKINLLETCGTNQESTVPLSDELSEKFTRVNQEREELSTKMIQQIQNHEQVLMKLQEVESEKVRLEEQIIEMTEALTKHDEDWQKYTAALKEATDVEKSTLAEKVIVLEREKNTIMEEMQRSNLDVGQLGDLLEELRTANAERETVQTEAAKRAVKTNDGVEKHEAEWQKFFQQEQNSTAATINALRTEIAQLQLRLETSSISVNCEKLQSEFESRLAEEERAMEMAKVEQTSLRKRITDLMEDLNLRIEEDSVRKGQFEHEIFSLKNRGLNLDRNLSEKILENQGMAELLKEMTYQNSELKEEVMRLGQERNDATENSLRISQLMSCIDELESRVRFLTESLSTKDADWLSQVQLLQDANLKLKANVEELTQKLQFRSATDIGSSKSGVVSRNDLLHEHIESAGTGQAQVFTASRSSPAHHGFSVQFDSTPSIFDDLFPSPVNIDFASTDHLDLKITSESSQQASIATVISSAHGKQNFLPTEPQVQQAPEIVSNLEIKSSVDLENHNHTDLHSGRRAVEMKNVFTSMDPFDYSQEGLRQENSGQSRMPPKFADTDQHCSPETDVTNCDTWELAASERSVLEQQIKELELVIDDVRTNASMDADSFAVQLQAVSIDYESRVAAYQRQWEVYLQGQTESFCQQKQLLLNQLDSLSAELEILKSRTPAMSRSASSTPQLATVALQTETSLTQLDDLWGGFSHAASTVQDGDQLSNVRNSDFMDAEIQLSKELEKLNITIGKLQVAAHTPGSCNCDDLLAQLQVTEREISDLRAKLEFLERENNMFSPPRLVQTGVVTDITQRSHQQLELESVGDLLNEAYAFDSETVTEIEKSLKRTPSEDNDLTSLLEDRMRLQVEVFALQEERDDLRNRLDEIMLVSFANTNTTDHVFVSNLEGKTPEQAQLLDNLQSQLVILCDNYCQTEHDFPDHNSELQTNLQKWIDYASQMQNEYQAAILRSEDLLAHVKLLQQEIVQLKSGTNPNAVQMEFLNQIQYGIPIEEVLRSDCSSVLGKFQATAEECNSLGAQATQFSETMELKNMETQTDLDLEKIIEQSVLNLQNSLDVMQSNFESARTTAEVSALLASQWESAYHSLSTETSELHSRVKGFETSLAALQEINEQLKLAESKLKAEQIGMNAHIEQHLADKILLQQQLAEMQKKCVELESEIATDKMNASAAELETQEKTIQLQDAAATIRRLQDEIRMKENELSHSDNRLQTAKKKLNELQENLSENSAKFSKELSDSRLLNLNLSEELKSAQNECDILGRQVILLREEISTLSAAVDKKQKMHDAFRERVSQEANILDQEIQDLRDHLQARDSAHRNLTGTITELKLDNENLHFKLKAERHRYREAKKSLTRNTELHWQESHQSSMNGDESVHSGGGENILATPEKAAVSFKPSALKTCMTSLKSEIDDLKRSMDLHMQVVKSKSDMR